jgi:hypothetical protein
MNKQWTNHVKMFAFKNHMNYFDALQNPDCQIQYKKKEKTNEGIKKLREEQNDLIINYLNTTNSSKQEFQKKYLEIEYKIKEKSETSKGYRELYKKKLRRKEYLKQMREYINITILKR